MIGDLIAAAAVVAAAADIAQPGLVLRLLSEADAAHRYFKRHRRPHALWGNGSLHTRALAIPLRAPPNLCDTQFLQVLAAISTAVAAHKSFAAMAGRGKTLGSPWTCRKPAPYDIWNQKGAHDHGRNQIQTCLD